LKNENPVVNKVHIAGRGLVVRQLRILVSQFHVLRTGTLSEIRPDNMYQPLCATLKTTRQTNNAEKNERHNANASAKPKELHHTHEANTMQHICFCPNSPQELTMKVAL